MRGAESPGGRTGAICRGEKGERTHSVGRKRSTGRRDPRRVPFFFFSSGSAVDVEWKKYRAEGTQFIHTRFVLVLDLFQIILQLMLEIIDLTITSLRSERSSSRKGSDQYYSTSEETVGITRTGRHHNSKTYWTKWK